MHRLTFLNGNVAEQLLSKGVLGLGLLAAGAFLKGWEAAGRSCSPARRTEGRFSTRSRTDVDRADIGVVAHVATDSASSTCAGEGATTKAVGAR